VQGVYRFHQYAASVWPHLVGLYFKSKCAIEDSDAFSRLVARLDGLRLLRANDGFSALESRQNYENLAPLNRNGTRDAYDLVCQELELQRVAKNRQFKLGEGKEYLTPTHMWIKSMLPLLVT
jgi:hypothetical protein